MGQRALHGISRTQRATPFLPPLMNIHETVAASHLALAFRNESHLPTFPMRATANYQIVSTELVETFTTSSSCINLVVFVPKS